MKPIDFPQSTKVLQRPETMTDAECTSLHVWNDGKQCISCWKPSAWERIKILFGQNLWLGVCSGKTQPPVFIAAEPVFEKAPAKDRIKEWFTDLWENLVAMFKSIIQCPMKPTNASTSWPDSLSPWLLASSFPLLVSSPDLLPHSSKNGGIQRVMERLSCTTSSSQTLEHLSPFHWHSLFTI